MPARALQLRESLNLCGTRSCRTNRGAIEQHIRWDYFIAFAWCFTAFACAVRLLKHGRFVSLSQWVNDACIAANGGGDEWKCIFAEHTSPHIKTPIFPLQVWGATIYY